MTSAQPIDAKQASSTDYWFLGLIATAVSVSAFLYYFRHDQLLLYGDAVAHMNIARRVIDSRTPGPLQLGTVWLPLPHVLMLPFIGSTWAWRTGVAGAIPSMAAFIFGAIGLFRLVHNGLLVLRERQNVARTAAWFAAAIYLANPNLLYLQATAMTEPLYLVLFIWSAVYLAEFVQHLREANDVAARRSLLLCGIVLFLAMFTRYDGWFAAALYGISAIAALLVLGRRRGRTPFNIVFSREWRRSVIGFCALLLAPPAIWLTYNYAIFKNPLEFATGPYSARAIEQRTTGPGAPHHPGWKNPKVAGIYFEKSAQLNLSGVRWQARAWLAVAALGSGVVLVIIRPLWPWLLLWVPLPFYAISIAWGGVLIFIPPWWPFSYYNVRYGTQLLPAITVFVGLLICCAMRMLTKTRWRAELGALAAVFVAASYVTAARQTPICLREAIANSRTRIAIERKLSSELAKLPADSTLLMYTGDHGGALQRIGFPMRRTINEGNFPTWSNALRRPSEFAQYVIAGTDDPLGVAVQKHPEGLEKIASVDSPGQGTMVIYRSMAYRAPAQ